MSEILSSWKLSAIKQQLLLPEALVFYMAMNPSSPEAYHKLIRCCKYFWLKNPVITLSSLHHFHDSIFWKTLVINGILLQENQNLKIENLNEKLWYYWSLTIFDERNQLAASSFIPRIYRCDLRYLSLGYQTVSIGEFVKFTSSGTLESLDLYRTTVKNGDGTIVPIEKLIELLPNLQAIYYENVSGEDGLHTITSETAASLVAIPHFPKMKIFSLYEIPESFDFEAFFAIPKVRTVINCQFLIEKLI